MFSRKHIYAVFAVAGLFGFLIGMAGHGQWQDAVEVAQVTAGVVHYPQGNPVYIYSTKVWAIYVQLCALLLRAGVTERILSLVLSGILGMVSFQALALCTLALCRNPLLSLLIPSLSLMTGSYHFYHTYPIQLVSGYTFGVMGLSYFLLLISFFSLNEMKPGAFLLGLAPAIHMSIGAFAWLFTAVCFLWDFRFWYPRFRKMVLPLCAGLCVTLVSFLIYRFITYDVPAGIPHVVTSKYFWTFVTLWDGHRQMPRLHDPGIYAGAVSLLLCFFWIYRFRDDLPRPALFLLWQFILSAVCGIGISILFQFVPMNRFPEWLVILMPARILNLCLLGFLPLVIGLWAARGSHFFSEANIFVLSSLLLMTAFFPKHMAGRPFWQFLLASGIVLFFFRAAVFVKPGFLKFSRFHTIPKLANMMIFFGVLLMAFHASFRAWRRGSSQLKISPFFAEMAKRPGMILTASYLRQIQLRTRRPVLLDGGSLDMIPYTLEAAPAVRRILRDAYGMSFFHPRVTTRPSGSIIGVVNIINWTHWDLARWKQIRKEFGVRDVLVFTGWKLKLPVAAQDSEYVLYEIP